MYDVVFWNYCLESKLCMYDQYVSIKMIAINVIILYWCIRDVVSILVISLRLADS